MKAALKQSPKKTFTLSQVIAAWDTYKDKRVLMGYIGGELKMIEVAQGKSLNLIPGLTQAQWHKFKDTPQGKDFPAFLEAFCNG